MKLDMDTTRTALLVDDEPESRAAQLTRLEREGYTVFVAHNQADAIARASQAIGPNADALPLDALIRESLRQLAR